MLYVIFGEDTEGSLEQRLMSRSMHLSRLEDLKKAGRLILAGPFPAVDSNEPDQAGFTGSLIVAEFDSLHEAETWAKADPYLESGVYKKVTVKPFKKVLP
jgi:uncharacterized protein YciI